MTNITSVTVTFGHGIKREEYGPVKKAEASITASVAENEDGEAVLVRIGELALARVAIMLDALKPEITAKSASSPSLNPEFALTGEPPKRRGRPPKEKPTEEVRINPEPAAANAGGNTTEPEPEPEPEPAADSLADDDWEAGETDIEITDAEIRAATSKRAGELGAREPIVKLIATFATRTEGAPFKVQEIPQNQRKDYLLKLAALAA